MKHNAAAMNTLNLSAHLRALTGRKTNRLRETGLVPAIVYGAETDPVSITINRNEFAKIHEAAGESSIVELAIDENKSLHVLIHDFQIDPLRDEISHVDFRSVNMNKEIEAEVELDFTGEAPAVKALGGTLVVSCDKVKVRSLPKFLVRSIHVDVSTLATFEDVIRVSDLIVPEGLTILEASELSIVGVEAPRTDAELQALNEAVEEDIAAVADVKEKKVDETVTAESTQPEKKSEKK